MRGRREKELESRFTSDDHLGSTIRAWRHFRGLSVTELAIQAGFGKNGRGYISRIEHDQIKRLGEEQLAAIAQALDLTQIDLQQHQMPETQVSPTPDKDTLDSAIAGCIAWLRVYSQDEKRLDHGRTYFKLAELYWERMALAEGRNERDQILPEALECIEKALSLFYEEAPDSYEEAQKLRAAIQKEIHIKDLDDAITGCKSLLKVYYQEKKSLDWARTQTKLAQLYWDRTLHAEKVEERNRLFVQALQSVDQALPLFDRCAPVSYTEAQRLREDLEVAREETLRSRY